MSKILIIEDDQTFTRILEGYLKKNNYEVSIAHDGKSGLASMIKENFSLVLLDYRLPDFLGTELLDLIKSRNKEIPVIIMTSFHDVKTAVKSIKAGAFDYITKPINPDELLLIIEEVQKKTASLKSHLKIPSVDLISDYFIGKSAASLELTEYIKLVAPTDLSVVLEGESGSGKEYVARRIHYNSKRRAKPFVAIDCGTISQDLAVSELFGHTKGAFTGATENRKGYFESANGGTLFLDEIGNLAKDVQAKLLRAIQERAFQPLGSTRTVTSDLRIIVASNENLWALSENGLFREDLYFRLNEFSIKVPRLAQRKEDLMDLANHFLILASRELNVPASAFDSEVTEVFLNYSWPGNIRELKNLVRRALLLANGAKLNLMHLPQDMVNAPAQNNSTGKEPLNLKMVNEASEKELISSTLKETKYNKSETARLLDIDRKTLYSKIKKYNIDH